MQGKLIFKVKGKNRKVFLYQLINDKDLFVLRMLRLHPEVFKNSNQSKNFSYTRIFKNSTFTVADLILSKDTLMLIAQGFHQIFEQMEK